MNHQPLNIETSTLEFKDRNSRTPLYRPAALRRNHSSSAIISRPSSPLSPPISNPNLDVKSWSAISGSLPWNSTVIDAEVRGSIISRGEWADAIDCFEDDCSVAFGLVNRKHHCRRCGNVFCASHSSRTTLLWPNPEPSRPSTPSLDIPAILIASLSATSISSPTSSPRPAPASSPISARVCDQCYFSVPFDQETPLMTPPPSSNNSSYSYTSKPLAFRSRNSTPIASPAQSPPYTQAGELYTSRGKRSRHGSINSAGSASSSIETPPTSFSSLEGAPNRSRGVSPAASLRGKTTFVEGVEEEEELEEGEEERFELEEAREREQDRLEREKEFGSVIGGGWATWATF